MEVRKLRLPNEVAERRAVEQVVGGGPVRALAEPRGRVCLGIKIDHEGGLTGFRETGCEVDRGRRLADTALLIRQRVDAGRHSSQPTAADGRSRGSTNVS